MCNVNTAAAPSSKVNTAATLSSIVLQAYGGFSSARQQQSAGQQENRYYNYLADISENNAGLVQDQAARDTLQLRREANRTIGSQRAAMAANGVSGVTAEDVITDTLSEADIDASAIRYNADMKTYNARVEAAGYRTKGAQAKASGDVTAYNTLLGTATSVAGSWLAYSQTSMGKTPKRASATQIRSAAMNTVRDNLPSSKLSLFGTGKKSWWQNNGTLR